MPIVSRGSQPKYNKLQKTSMAVLAPVKRLIRELKSPIFKNATIASTKFNASISFKINNFILV